ncbi:MAG: pyridoxamine 5'-phosphate oxidase family protein [Ruminococcaceae bacterium]|nr:pyridoxamine 5'-phosphate oxidase family protein [Oscillospiraceae bacterium]
MFRGLIRKKQQITEEECLEILSKETRGVLSVNGDCGYPYGMPMNHFYNPEDGCIYFHCSKIGHRLDSLRESDKVSFCVYEHGYRKEGEWALNTRSVIIFGRIEVIDDINQVVNITTKLCYKFTQDEKYIQKEIQTGAKATLLLKLIPEHMCGKRVEES